VLNSILVCMNHLFKEAVDLISLDCLSGFQMGKKLTKD
jgi:hypothetical protein